jgi:hypothetical protein
MASARFSASTAAADPSGANFCLRLNSAIGPSRGPQWLACRSDEIGNRASRATPPERVADGFAVICCSAYLLRPLSTRSNGGALLGYGR